MYSNGMHGRSLGPSAAPCPQSKLLDFSSGSRNYKRFANRIEEQILFLQKMYFAKKKNAATKSKIVICRFFLGKDM